jgi:hypothetical protein
MALDLKQNTKNEGVPCLPCCFGVLEGCACADTSVNLKVHLFTQDLFDDNPAYNAATRNDVYSASGIGGPMTCDTTADGTVFTQSGSIASPSHTWATQIRNNTDGTWVGRSNIDGAGYGAWVPLSKTYSNENMFRVEGTLEGYDILLHGFCLCSLRHLDGLFYPGHTTDYYYLNPGVTLYASVTGLPSCFSSVTNSFSFVTGVTAPVTVGNCTGLISSSSNSAYLYSYNVVTQMSQAAIICNAGYPVLFVTYNITGTTFYGTNISDPGYAVGTVRNLGDHNLVTVNLTQSQFDLSSPLTLDLHPFYMNGKTRMDGTWQPGTIDRTLSPVYLSDHPYFVEVTITE